MQGRLLAALILAALAAVPSIPVGADHDVPAHRLWSTIPHGPYGTSAQGAAFFPASDGTPISYHVWLPSPLPAGGAPVILTAGPYFGLLEEPVDQPSTGRLSGFLVDNYVSHGYAVVAASVRGTGRSGGCVELYSDREVQDIHELVNFLAAEPWSNGAVGMTGKSYDGGLAWAVAGKGSPALKTIVPIAGFTDEGDLTVHRGVPELRAPIFHPVVYYPFGFGVDPLGARNGERPIEARAENANCPEVVEGSVAGAWASTTGDIHDPLLAAPYYAERNWRPGVEANYDGSIFVVHGLRDFNTNPSNTIPWVNSLANPTKLLLGQWGHEYPDDAHYTPYRRADFAAMLKSWFDRWLLGDTTVTTGPAVLVEDFWTSSWRTPAAWPSPSGSVPFGLVGDDVPFPGRLAAGAEGDPTLVPIATPAGASLVCDGEDATVFDGPTSGIAISGVATLEVRLEGATNGHLVAVLCHQPSGSSAWYLLLQGATNVNWDDATGRTNYAAAPGSRDVVVEFEPAEIGVTPGTLRLVVGLDNAAAWRGMEFYHYAGSTDVAVLTEGTLRLPTR